MDKEVQQQTLGPARLLMTEILNKLAYQAFNVGMSYDEGVMEAAQQRKRPKAKL
jgi:hypothetical protein